MTATSGDTGKAALEGFKDVPGTHILVFYPGIGVSPMQKRQMVTQEGDNVAVCAIEGNFDDAQSSVKRIFTDAALQERLAQHGMQFSSANSINWGRLLPQIVYYIYAYLELVRTGGLSMGQPMDVVVPTETLEYSGRLLRAENGPSHPEADMRLQRQQSADRFYPDRHLRPPPGISRHSLSLDGYFDFQ